MRLLVPHADPGVGGVLEAVTVQLRGPGRVEDVQKELAPVSVSCPRAHTTYDAVIAHICGLMVL